MTTESTRSITMNNVANGKTISMALRISAYVAAMLAILFVVNNFLIFWAEWPGVYNLFAHLGLFGFEPVGKPVNESTSIYAWLQAAIMFGLIGFIVTFVVKTKDRALYQDSETLSNLAAYIIRGAFWAALLVGLADALISGSKNF